jgi:hypothetical protein
MWAARAAGVSDDVPAQKRRQPLPRVRGVDALLAVGSRTTSGAGSTDQTTRTAAGAPHTGRLEQEQRDAYRKAERILEGVDEFYQEDPPADLMVLVERADRDDPDASHTG